MLPMLHYTMNPPPRSRPPSYSTADCPAAGARTGSSHTMCTSPSGTVAVQGGFSHFVCRTRTLARIGSRGSSMSQLKFRAQTSVLKSSSQSASSMVFVAASMREIYTLRPSTSPMLCSLCTIPTLPVLPDRACRSRTAPTVSMWSVTGHPRGYA